MKIQFSTSGIIGIAAILFFITFQSCNSGASNENNSSNVQEQKESKALTEEEISSKNANELLIMRNEIFARHGYRFKNRFLTEYFSQFDWYKPQYDNVDDKLSDTEKKNIELIINAEKKLKDKDVTFESLIALFPDISNKRIHLNGDEQTEGSKNISKTYIEKYFGYEVVESYEGCVNIMMSSVGHFYFPEAGQVALICYEMTCPVPAVYLEYRLYVFDLDGNKLATYDLAHDRGDNTDFTHAEAIIDNGQITKHVKHSYWKDINEPDAGEIEEEYSRKVTYNPNSHTFKEVEL